MIGGRLERLISAGYLEGWAFDSDAPERPLAVEIRLGDGAVLAGGLANLYRDDLANARKGLGWCAFRLRLERPATELASQVLTLHERASGARIDRGKEIPLVDGDGLSGSQDEDTIGFDPFVIQKLSQLRACDGVLARYLRAKGANAFVRTAYVYMLGRSVDPEALALHAEMLRKGSLTPLRLLETVSDTTEFRARPRGLSAPNAPGFPFLQAANVG